MKRVIVVDPDRGVSGVGAKPRGRNRDGRAEFVIAIVAIRREQIERVSAAPQENANQRPLARVGQSRLMADRHLSKKTASRGCAHLKTSAFCGASAVEVPFIWRALRLLFSIFETRGKRESIRASPRSYQFPGSPRTRSALSTPPPSPRAR